MLVFLRVRIGDRFDSVDGETSIQVIDKNDGCIPTSDEEIMSDDDFESDSDYLSVC